MNNLRKLTIPSSVTKIGNIAFANNHFTSVVVPETVTSMGFEVFLARIPNGDPTPNYRGGAVITGVAKSGNLLTVNKGSWSSEKKATYSYQWYSCTSRNRWVIRATKIPTDCDPITSATGNTFKLTKQEKNKFVTVLITAKSSFGSTKILSATLGLIK
ncbi:MAG: leucine-rich repeat protein [Actinomycetes bacterium]